MSRIQTSVGFAMILAAVGGFLDAYSYIHAGVFAGAQTGNVVLLAVHLAKQEWQDTLRSVVPITSFALGSSVGGSLGLETVKHYIRSPAKAALVLEVMLLTLVGVPPVASSHVPTTVLLSFVAGVQMAVFTKVSDWSFSTTVTTSNITKWMSSLVETVGGHDDSARSQAAAFTGIVLSFVAGGTAAGFLVPRLHTLAIIVAGALLLIALTWLVIADCD